MKERDIVFILDDDPNETKTLCDILLYKGYMAVNLDENQDVLKAVMNGDPHVVLLDLKLERLSGLDLMKDIKKSSPRTECIILTGYASQASAIEAVNYGAYGYLQKPYDMEQLLLMIKRAVENKKKSEELIKSEEQYRNLFNNVNDAIFIHNFSDRFIEVNKVACDYLGYNKEELLNMGPEDIYVNLDSIKVSKIIKELKEKGIFSVETENIRKDGTIVPVEINSSIIIYKDEKVILTSVRDISKRKKADNMIYYRFSMEKLLADISSRFNRLSWENFDEELNCAMKSIGIFFNVDRVCLSFLYDHKTIKKRYEWCAEGVNKRDYNHVTNFMMHSSASMKKLVLFEDICFFSINDIPAEWEIERKFWEIHGIKSVLSIPLRFGDVLYGYMAFETNRCEKMWEDEDRRFLKLVGEIFINLFERKRGYETLKNSEENLKKEKENFEKTARELEIAYNELKSAQSKIVQAEKMASIGQLAAGIAHEINNPVGFIAGNLRALDKYINKFSEFIQCQFLIINECAGGDLKEGVEKKRKELKIDYISKDIKELVRESLEGTERVAKIVQDLKVFSRMDDVTDCKFADINKCMESTLNIVWNELKYKATIIKEYGNLPEVKCYPRQISQVFMNLLVNASQAIEKQGEIVIKTWSENGFVLVSIRDNGMGIEKDGLQRIFDPFFTTKEVGIGTGLGLSISYDIIKKHNGEILVDSEPGKGTVFTIKIPI